MIRSPMPLSAFTDANQEMAEEIQGNPTFSAIMNQLMHEREVAAIKHKYVYSFTKDAIAGQTSAPVIVSIEQGSDFLCEEIYMSAFSYDACNNTSFPMPGATAFACRGLSIQITETGSGRDLTNGWIPIELLATPGYGVNIQAHSLKWHMLFQRNAKIRFDVRNRDGALRTHDLSVAMVGSKIYSPQ